MSRRLFYWLMCPAFVLMIPGAAAAQDRQQPLPPLETFGPLFQVTWISGISFTGSDNTLLRDLQADFGQYYRNHDLSPVTRYAEVRLPAGAKLAAIQCLVRDDSVGANINLQFVATAYNVVTNTPGPGFETPQFGSSGTGYQEPTVILPSGGYLIRYEVGDIFYLHHLLVFLPFDTGIRGCRLIWQRTVSAAPGTASFNDVPLGHPQRQFIEALTAAGITGGCGGGNYCPDAPVTRGQMAVFLSAALGLFWPF